jgi:low affinity Fe/Cu permease
MKNLFRRISNRVSAVAGSAAAFLGAFLIVVVWATTGPLFGFSDTWQLVINTGTTIVTFLMVFLIQNTQNRDGKAMQLKLDELIRTSSHARNAFMGLEALTDEELAQLDGQFRVLHDGAASSDVMKKLHATIQLEHQRRKVNIPSVAQMNELLHKLAAAGSKQPPVDKA